MKISFITTCPYCKFENRINREITPGSTEELIYCNSENGGCDKQFAIKYAFEINPIIQNSSLAWEIFKGGS